MRGGKRAGAGRKPSIKTQAREWKEEHPNAYAELMDLLYARAEGRYIVKCPHCKQEFRDSVIGDSESARYIIDRIKGKPRQQTELDLKGVDRIGAGTVRELFELLLNFQKQLAEGKTPELPNGHD